MRFTKRVAKCFVEIEASLYHSGKAYRTAKIWLENASSADVEQVRTIAQDVFSDPVNHDPKDAARLIAEKLGIYARDCRVQVNEHVVMVTLEEIRL